MLPTLQCFQAAVLASGAFCALADFDQVSARTCAQKKKSPDRVLQKAFECTVRGLELTILNNLTFPKP